MILKYLHESAPLVFRALFCMLFDWLFFSGYLVSYYYTLRCMRYLLPCTYTLMYWIFDSWAFFSQPWVFFYEKSPFIHFFSKKEELRVGGCEQKDSFSSFCNEKMHIFCAQLIISAHFESSDALEFPIKFFTQFMHALIYILSQQFLA